MIDAGYIISNLVWAILGGFFGAIIALGAEKYRKPKLEIASGEDANSDNTYPAGHLRAGQRWKFFRVRVTNRPIPKFLSWILQRETAQQVNARITFRELGVTLKGRWAGSLELAQANPLDLSRLANFPDPVTIVAGEPETLDVFAKFQGDQEAYGWNNESYLNNWKTPLYKLVPGDYQVEVQVTTFDGIQAKKLLRVHIDKTIEDTYLK